jgi:hypothetical protein
VNKARLNYWVDLATGLAFVLSAASGIVFLLPSSLADGQLRILGISYQAWNQLHTWSSFVMVAGALLHVALHWQWVVSMTKKTIRPATSAPIAIAQPTGGMLTRRRLLQLGALGLASGIAFVGFRALSDAAATPAAIDDGPDLLPSVGAVGATATPTDRPRSSATAQPTRQPGGSTTARPTVQPKESTAAQPTRQPGESTTEQSSCLACPKRVTYDRYPGRCRLYLDKDRDGYCDYSIPGSCNNTDLRAAPGSSTPNKRPGSTSPGSTF